MSHLLSGVSPENPYVVTLSRLVELYHSEQNRYRFRPPLNKTSNCSCSSGEYKRTRVNLASGFRAAINTA